VINTEQGVFLPPVSDTIGGRYDLGLANISDTDSDADASTGTFMVTLGFAL
jgi:hypothetical protein